MPRPEITPRKSGWAQRYRAQSVVVTGAGGSIGAELARQLIAVRPARLVLFELCEYALFRIDQDLRPLAEAAGVPLIPVLGSCGDASLAGRVLQQTQAQIVLHAAAYKHVPLVEQNPEAGLSNNVLATETLLQAAISAKCARFVLISSDKAVAPVGVMGASKRLAEMVVQDMSARVPQLQAGIVRFGNVMGSSGSVVPTFAAQVGRGGPVTVTDRRMTRYIMTINEAVALVLEAGAMAQDAEIFVLEMGRPVRIVDLARQVIEAMGHRVQSPADPDGIEICFTGRRPGEKLHESLTSAHSQQPTAHPKIFSVSEPRLSELEMALALRRVRRIVTDGAAQAGAEALAALLASCAPAETPEADARLMGT